MLLGNPILAQPADTSFNHLLTNPKVYAAPKTREKIEIDGHLNEAVWKQAEWSDYFQDIEGSAKPLPLFNTKFKICYDNHFLYIAAFLEEPHINGSLNKRDQVIYYDNDFEVFIDPHGSTHNYFEIEINALNTIFDLYLPKPYRNGGHADIKWDAEGLLTAVNILGTLNDPSDIDSAWIIEMAIPFAALNTTTPENGSSWNINFSRVQWQYDLTHDGYTKTINPETAKPFPEYNWVWSPQGVINMHYPERWGYLYFAGETIGEKEYTLPDYHVFKKWMWQLYYHQKEYKRLNNSYANSLLPLKIKPPEACRLILEAGENNFKAQLLCDKNQFFIDQGGYFEKNLSYE